MIRVAVIGLFAIAGIAFAVVGWFARRRGSTVPTLGDIAGFVMAYQVGRAPVGRIALLGFWWWAGWHFFAR
jgi:hypothetical protein